MHKLLVLAVTLGIANADIGLGYHYKVPQISYGVPAYQSGSSSYNYNQQSSGQYPSLSSSNSAYQTGGYQNLGSAGSSYPSAGSGASYQISGSGTGSQTGYLGSQSGYQSAGSGGAYQSSGYGTGYQNGGLSTGYQTGGSGTSYQSSNLGNYYPSASTTGNAAQGGYQSLNQYQTSSQYQSNVNKYQQYQYVTQPAQVFKHFYVHAAPEDEVPQPKQPIALPPAQKHYKIIFIKAPTQSYPAPIIPVQPQNEEKTIVYVLVKKEDAQNIVLPKFEHKAPTKPEVYFIKYNGKEDSQAVINNIVNDYNKGGANINYTPGESHATVSGGVSNLDISGSLNAGTGSAQAIGAGNSVQSGSSISYDEVSSGSSVSGGQASSGSQYGSISEGESLSAGSFSGGQITGESVSNAVASAGYVEASSTASSIGYDNSNLISTSQGVPYETYGPPKFRI